MGQVRDISQAVQYLKERTIDFAKSPAGQNGKYTPHPATWFNAGRYSDEDAEWNLHEGKGGNKNGAGGFHDDEHKSKYFNNGADYCVDNDAGTLVEK